MIQMAAQPALAARSFSRPAVVVTSWALLLGLAAVKLSVHLLSSGWLTYGYMTDELYYLDCADHLAWGYVDHPPLSVGILWLVRATLGDSLLALRLLPALAGCATVVLVGLMAGELGGGRVAQGLAALAALISPVYLAVGAFYSMNAFEPALWALAAYLLLRVHNGASPRLWLAIGVVVGLGLLNKISMSWLGLGLAVGLVLTPERRWLVTPWPWCAAAIALALFAPHIVWQAQHDWATLEFMRNAGQYKLPLKTPLTFLGEQVLIMNPLVVPFWLAGLLYYFTAPDGRRVRLLGWVWITVFLLLIAQGATRSNYIAPAYSVLLAAGGVAVERGARRRSWRWLPSAVAAAFALGGAALLPFAVDLLPPERFVAYQRAIGLEAPTDDVTPMGNMPLHFALKFHAQAVFTAVSRAYADLQPEDRARVGILTRSFGEAGAINFFGPAVGLPHAISAHNNYWLWGPGAYRGEVMLAVGYRKDELHALFEHIENAGAINCDYCMPELTATSVYLCRSPRRPLAEIWSTLKNYV
jgi:4-amino-4-deoxy-L-arabinose transferase-like glycosyltransferase